MMHNSVLVENHSSGGLLKSALHSYQHKAVKFIKARPSCALFLDPGLGKTVITLTALVDFINANVAGKILIVAPKRVIESVWRQEAAKWAHTQHLSFSLITGTPSQRAQALANRADIYLINYENLVWMIESGQFDFDTVVFDELSKMKSTKAKRFKRFKSVMHKVCRVIGLTGTPASNGLLDLYAQIFLLDGGERLGRTFFDYQHMYFIPDYMGYDWTLKPGAEKIIQESIQNICLSLSSSDYFKLPKRIDNVIEVELPARAAQQYKALERDYLLDFDSNSVEAVNAAVLTGKLLQFCNGAVYIDDEHNWEAVHQAKLDALDNLINEAAGQPVLVAYTFQSDKARLKARFKQAVCISDEGALERWNRGEIPLLIAHPANAGYGLNLQAGGNIVVWFGLSWSLELYSQFSARIHRQGQIKPVFIHHLVVKNSVDETVMTALQEKHIGQKALLDALKRDIEHRA